MSLEENENLVRRYVQAIDENQTSDWASSTSTSRRTSSRTTLCIPTSASTVKG